MGIHTVQGKAPIEFKSKEKSSSIFFELWNMTSTKADYIYRALQKVTANKPLFKKWSLKDVYNKITLP